MQSGEIPHGRKIGHTQLICLDKNKRKKKTEGGGRENENDVERERKRKRDGFQPLMAITGCRVKDICHMESIKTSWNSSTPFTITK